MKKVRFVLSTLAVGAAFVGTYAAVNDDAATRYYVVITGGGGGATYTCQSVSDSQTCTITAPASGNRCTISVSNVSTPLFRDNNGSGTTPCLVNLYKPV